MNLGVRRSLCQECHQRTFFTLFCAAVAHACVCSATFYFTTALSLCYLLFCCSGADRVVKNHKLFSALTLRVRINLLVKSACFQVGKLGCKEHTQTLFFFAISSSWRTSDRHKVARVVGKWDLFPKMKSKFALWRLKYMHHFRTLIILVWFNLPKQNHCPYHTDPGMWQVLVQMSDRDCRD